jgi:hypothetical protein
MTTETSLFGLTDKKEMVIGGGQGRVRARRTSSPVHAVMAKAC